MTARKVSNASRLMTRESRTTLSSHSFVSFGRVGACLSATHRTPSLRFHNITSSFVFTSVLRCDRRVTRNPTCRFSAVKVNRTRDVLGAAASHRHQSPEQGHVDRELLQ